MPNVLKIKTYGCEVLKKVAEPVEALTPEIIGFIEDLIYTMYSTEGVGIAAPQVGKSVRIFVCDPYYGENVKRKPIVLINPEYVKYEGEKITEEGCLSIPNVFEKIKRFEKVEVKYKDEKWNSHTLIAEDILATVLQHEIDHLNGILLTDKLNQLRKMALGFKLNRIAMKSEKLSNDVEIKPQDDT